MSNRKDDISPEESSEHSSSSIHARSGPWREHDQFINSNRSRHTSRNGQEQVTDPPERFESFILGDGETKVEMEHETRVPNATMFTFNKEDHTLGNLLRDKLHRAEHVIFAGYQVPHPLFAVVKLRVQTDGQVTPKEALKQACSELINELALLDQEVTKEFELKKIAGAGSGN